MKKKNDYFNLYCRVRASEKCSSIVMHCRSYGAVLLRYGTRDNAKGNKTVGKRQTKKLKLYTFLTRSDSFRPFYLHLKFFWTKMLESSVSKWICIDLIVAHGKHMLNMTKNSINDDHYYAQLFHVVNGANAISHIELKIWTWIHIQMECDQYNNTSRWEWRDKHPSTWHSLKTYYISMTLWKKKIVFFPPSVQFPNVFVSFEDCLLSQDGFVYVCPMPPLPTQNK